MSPYHWGWRGLIWKPDLWDLMERLWNIVMCLSLSCGFLFLKALCRMWDTLDKSEFNGYFISFEEHQYWLKEGKRPFLLSPEWTCFYWRTLMTAFVDISSDSFYLTCFQNPCWIFSVLKNCISPLKFRFGVWKNVQNDFADGLLRCRSPRNRTFCKGSHLFICRRAENLF